MSLIHCVAVYLIAVMLSCVMVNNAQVAQSAEANVASNLTQAADNGTNTANQTTNVSQNLTNSQMAAVPTTASAPSGAEPSLNSSNPTATMMPTVSPMNKMLENPMSAMTGNPMLGMAMNTMSNMVMKPVCDIMGSMKEMMGTML